MTGLNDDQIFGVYVHFPFCQARCTYCDFVFTTPKDIPQVEYTEAVLRELDARAGCMDGYRMVSIYLGGGTPSLWDPKHLMRLITAIRQRFVHGPDIEITLEANPGTIFDANLDAFLEAGVNRVSLGVQTFQPELLMSLGRQHSLEDTHRSLTRLAQHPELHNFSADLMYNLPGTTVADVQRDFQTLTSYTPNHISLYGLTIEPETALYNQVARNVVTALDHDASTEQSIAVLDLLEQSPWDLYEISNAARPGFRAVHNSLYWAMSPYLGLGVGAHGLEPLRADLVSPEASWVRRANTRSLRVPPRKVDHTRLLPVASRRETNASKQQPITVL